MCFRNILCISWVTAKDLGTEADVPLGIIRYPVHIQDHDRRHSKNFVPWDRMHPKCYIINKKLRCQDTINLFGCAS